MRICGTFFNSSLDEGDSLVIQESAELQMKKTKDIADFSPQLTYGILVSIFIVMTTPLYYKKLSI
ncbi:MAG: hypothetical protein AYK19_05960 [Theionarchaea archaeon DG-70-1]|nr:MAG: hypothetical protein AYK19_05960 [Theionarchaea archaeon DG-70-1]